MAMFKWRSERARIPRRARSFQGCGALPLTAGPVARSRLLMILGMLMIPVVGLRRRRQGGRRRGRARETRHVRGDDPDRCDRTGAARRR